MHAIMENSSVRRCGKHIRFYRGARFVRRINEVIFTVRVGLSFSVVTSPCMSGGSLVVITSNQSNKTARCCHIAFCVLSFIMCSCVKETICQALGPAGCEDRPEERRLGGGTGSRGTGPKGGVGAEVGEVGGTDPRGGGGAMGTWGGVVWGRKCGGVK